MLSNPVLSGHRVRAIVLLMFVVLAALLASVMLPADGAAAQRPGSFCQPNVGFTKLGTIRGRKAIFGYGNVGSCRHATLELQRRKGVFSFWETVGRRDTRMTSDQYVGWFCYEGRRDMDYRTMIVGANGPNDTVHFKWSYPLKDVEC